MLNNLPPPANDILDVREAAQYLRINEQTIRRLARDRQLPAFKVGGAWRFKRSVLDQWAADQQSLQPQRRILVVDDDARVREIVDLTLRPQGYTVVLAESGEKGLEEMRAAPADMVFLDLRMPGMDGVQVLERIRSEWGPIPVVILTGYPESEALHRALQHSPITLLSKPFTLDQLVNCAKSYLGH